MFDDFDIDEGENREGEAPAPAAEGLSPPRAASSCLGHEIIEKDIIAAWKAGRMPHALIFAGPEGIGKATMAFRLARFLLKQGTGLPEDSGPGLFGEALPAAVPETMDVSSDDLIYKQVASGGHPDLLIVERPLDEKKEQLKDILPVQEVRRINPFLQKTAAQGGWRIVVVDDADTMNRNSQNAILKVLEEPPPHTVLILIAHQAGALLPTIRSRARTFTFQALPPEIFKALLKKPCPELTSGDADILYAVSGGSIGQGIRILEEGGLETVNAVTALLNGWPRWSWPQIHGLADNLSRSGRGDGLRAFRNILLWITGSFVRVKALGSTLPGVLNSGALAALHSHYSLKEWVEINDNLRQHFDMADHANLDKRQAVLGAFTLLNREKAA